MRLWLDDLRGPPDHGWTWVRTVEEAKTLLERGDVAEASLDNDLGEQAEEGRRLCLWMAEHGVWPRDCLVIHSANPPASDYMCGIVERHGPYRRQPGSTRFLR